MKLQHPTRSYIVNGRVLQPCQLVEVEDANPNLPILLGLGFEEIAPAPAQNQGQEGRGDQGPGDSTPQGEKSPQGGDSETPEQKAAREKAERVQKIKDGKAKAKAAREAATTQTAQGA